MFRALTRAFAVNRLRARHDNFFDREIFFTNDFEHLRGAKRIHLHVFRHLRHVAAVGRLMKNDVGARKRVLNRGTIAHIALHKFGVAVDPSRPAAFVGVRFEVIENPHAPAFAHKQIGNVRTN